MDAKIKVNPHYVSSLLGPLALAVANDENRDVLVSIDYSNSEQIRLVISSLIRPNFERLTDLTRLELARALSYFLSQSNVASKVIEEKLLLCEVPPDCHQLFLAVLWDSLFPGASAADTAGSVSGIVNRPLSAGEYSFARKAARSLNELVDALRAQQLD